MIDEDPNDRRSAEPQPLSSLGMMGMGAPAMGGMMGAPADKFGLPLNWTSETKEQRLDRAAAVVGVVQEVYDAAVDHLGTKNVRWLWKEVAKGKPGRPKGSKNPELDDLMLRKYDSFIVGKDEKGRKEATRKIAELWYNEGPDRYRVDVRSIERRLRRLLAAREQAARQLAANMFAQAPLGLPTLGAPQQAIAENPRGSHQKSDKNPG